MAVRTIYVFAKNAVTITRANGASTSQSDVLGNALNGNAFSWENPHNLALTFGTTTTAITLDDADGVLGDDPYSGSNVIDQRLTEPVTINGQTFTPSPSTVRWANPPPVTVENEYEVTLYDAAGLAYRMVGISITTGYSTQVVGVAFDGAAPPAGTTLYYLQGQSSYGGTGQTVTNRTTVPCFLAGTLIDTPKGPVPAERLAAGDRVFTLDSGAKKLRWVGRSVVDGTGSCAPIRIRAGVLGNRRDLLVSPNHRVLIEAWVAELHFGQRQVLVPAKALVDGVNVLEVPMAQADYVHLLLPRHELVFSEGVASESLFVSEMGLGAFGPEARADLSEVITRRDLISQKLARTALTVAEARAMQVFARSRKTRTGRPFMALAS